MVVSSNYQKKSVVLTLTLNIKKTLYLVNTKILQ